MYKIEGFVKVLESTANQPISLQLQCDFAGSIEEQRTALSHAIARQLLDQFNPPEGATLQNLKDVLTEVQIT